MASKKVSKEVKVILTVAIKKELMVRIKSLVPCGKISEVVEKLLEEKTDKMEEEIAKQYQQEARDEILDQEQRSWYIIHKGKSVIKEPKANNWRSNQKE